MGGLERLGMYQPNPLGKKTKISSSMIFALVHSHCCGIKCVMAWGVTCEEGDFVEEKS